MSTWQDLQLAPQNDAWANLYQTPVTNSWQTVANTPKTNGWEQLYKPFEKYLNQAVLAGQTLGSWGLGKVGVNYEPNRNLIKKVQDAGMLSEQGTMGGKEIWKSGLNTADVMLKTYGLSNPALATKSMLAGGALNTGINAYQNIRQGNPLLQGTQQAMGQGMVSGLANAGTTRLTSSLVQGLSGKLPFLKPLTNESLQAGLPTGIEPLKEAIGKWANVAGKKLIKGAVLETLIETPIWATLTQTDQETYLQAIGREAVENLKMNIAFAGVDSLSDARTLTPIVKGSIDDAIQNYKDMPIDKKMGGYVNMYGGKIDSSKRTETFDKAVFNLKENPNASPTDKSQAVQSVYDLAKQVLTPEEYKEMIGPKSNYKQKSATVDQLIDVIGKKVKDDVPLDIPNLLDSKIDLNAKVGGKPLPKNIAGTKFTEDMIAQKDPDIKLKRDVPATDIYGNKIQIKEGEALTPLQLTGNKVVLQDGETYVVSKNQYQNIKGQSISGEAKEFAPELKGTTETVKGGNQTKGQRKASDLQEGDDILVYGEKHRIDGINKFENGDIQVDFTDGEDVFLSANDKVEFLRGESPTKYSEYTLPGGENYKEILIQAPTDANYQVLADDKWHSFDTKQKQLDFAKKQKMDLISNPGFFRTIYKGDNFKSGHWDEKNVISHLRLNERTYNGKKVTFMEELQSDWAKDAREKGFVNNEQNLKELTDLKQKGGFDEQKATLTNKNNLTPSEIDRFDDLMNKSRNNSGVPYNPLVEKWQEPTIKRALKEAVDNDSEYFSWVTGEQTSVRYNLSKQVDEINWVSPTKASVESWDKEHTPGLKTVSIKPIGGNYLTIEIDKDGVIKNTALGAPNDWNNKAIDEVLGKGLADKIMKKKTGTLSGEGLKFGGEWANNLYDKQVKNMVEDLTGGKVEELDLGINDGRKLFYQKTDKGSFKVASADGIKKGDTISDTMDIPSFDLIVTDILGNGKFKVISKSRLGRMADDVTLEKGYKVTPEMLVKLSPDRINPLIKHTIDITKPIAVKQQGIRLTPEIKAKIRGESLQLKTGSLPKLGENND